MPKHNSTMLKHQKDISTAQLNCPRVRLWVVN